MYEELVKRVRQVAEEVCEDYDVDPYNAERRFFVIEEAANAVEELSRVQERWIAIERNALLNSIPRWIPVTERLPKCDLGAEVGNIEWISCGMVNAGCFGRGGKYRDAYFRTWTDAGEGMDAKDADYWRAVTLPEPPKEET